MNKKVLFTIAPAALLMSTLIGCNKTKEYTVKFDTDLGTAIDDVKVKEGSTVARPTVTPIKSGFTFTDWYTTKEGDTKFDFDNTKIVADTTIYAHYTVEPSVDFTIYPEGPLTIKKGEEKELQINFTDPKGHEAVKDIKWTFDDKYIEKVSEAEDHMTFKFKGKELTEDVGTFINVAIDSKSGGKAKEKSCQVHVEEEAKKNNINWNATAINDTDHGFSNETLYDKAKTATSVIFKQDNSTDGAAVGEDTTKDKIYAKYDNDTTTLTVWSNDKITFEDDDLVIVEYESVKYTMGVFYNCSSLVTLDLANVDTSAMTSMYAMFGECTSLTEIKNLTSLDTSNVTDMANMFGNCYVLASLDLSKFDTKKVTNMGMMFFNCRTFTSLDLSSFDTSNVIYMYNMFCSIYEAQPMKLQSISFGKKFNTGNVTSMHAMFNYCTSLTSLDLSSFDTSKVTSMRTMFQLCTSLTSLDLSNFSFEALTNSDSMFLGCSKLETIYAAAGTDLSGKADLTESTSMFHRCDKLKGEKGTAYDAAGTKNKGYARIDGGTSSPGFFSVKA